MKKRLTALLLCLVLCTGLIGMTTWAEGAETPKLRMKTTPDSTIVSLEGTGFDQISPGGKLYGAIYRGSTREEAEDNLLTIISLDVGNSGTVSGTFNFAPGAPPADKDDFIKFAFNYNNTDFIYWWPDDDAKPTYGIANSIEPAGAGAVKFTVGENENATSAAEGDTVTVVPLPNDGYVFDTFEVKAADGSSVTSNTANKTFTMPAKAVTVTVRFTKKSEEQKYEITGVTISGDESLCVGGSDGTLTASATTNPSGGTVSYKWEITEGDAATLTGNTNEPSVTVHPEKVGKVKVKVTAAYGTSEKSATCDVTVEYQINSPLGNSLTLGSVGTTLEIPGLPDGTQVTWSSSNTGVVQVDANGWVIPTGVGSATITAAFTVDGKSYTVEYPITITAGSGSGGSVTTPGTTNRPQNTGSSGGYNVSIGSTNHGKVTVDNRDAATGATVTITATPDSGYEVATVTVTDANGKGVEVSGSGTTYTFTQPNAKPALVSVTFKRIAAEGEYVNEVPSIFTDVAQDAYYYDAVNWAVDLGITAGTTSTTFSPDDPCTRAQMVTFLWRAAGKPSPSSTANPFTDVPAGQYYTDAVLWAVGRGVTNGTSPTTFNPYGIVTRAQTVTFLYRYAGSPAAAASSTFTDVPAGQYYTTAVQWAVNNGITTGYGDGTFGPNNYCKRAAIVTFLHRYLGAKT